MELDLLAHVHHGSPSSSYDSAPATTLKTVATKSQKAQNKGQGIGSKDNDKDNNDDDEDGGKGQSQGQNKQ